ncbi:unnamed protein product [Phytophthora fragariaefolia]|uniref:Unnamed protein product n=1 Tax=Phytophthora fragariaefolia TaxID=1490495 RepID=A0A9W6X9T1_9STRA|nr:unnamed protein product [Phytophthora fragariaefolia]
MGGFGSRPTLQPSPANSVWSRGSAHSDYYDGYDDPADDQGPDRYSVLPKLHYWYPVGGGGGGWRLPRLPTRRVGSNLRLECPRSAPDARSTQPVAWTPFDGNDAALLPEPVRLPEPGGCADATLAVWVVDSSCAVCPSSAGDDDSAANAERSDSDWKSAYDGWGAASSWGNAFDRGSYSDSRSDSCTRGTDSEWTAPPNPASYGPPQAPPPYGYGNAYGQAPDPRRYGMPSTIWNAIKMVQPFYSDSTTVDKARTFWNAFERATEGVDNTLRLSAFRDCLKGKTGEQWWTYSRIDTFETLRKRFHNQFVCQPPLQMIERLKTTKRSKAYLRERYDAADAHDDAEDPALVGAATTAEYGPAAAIAPPTGGSGRREGGGGVAPSACLWDDTYGSTSNRLVVLSEWRRTVNAVPGDCEFDDYDVNLNDNYYYDNEAEDYDYEGREEDAMPNETAAYDPTEHDYDDAKLEADACAQQAATVTTARDEGSAPEPDYDRNDYNPENYEVEACAQQATLGTATRDEESALSPEHDHYGDEPEADACSRQTASVNEARDAGPALEHDDEYDVATVVEACTPLSAAVSTAPGERPATEAAQDGSVSAVRILFQGPLCGLNPKRSVVYESFGRNTGWGPARAALAAQERAAPAEACGVSTVDVSSSSDPRRTDGPKGGVTAVKGAPVMTNTLDPSPLTGSILREEDGSDPGPTPERPLTGSILSEEDGSDPSPAPGRDRPEEDREEPSPHARVFTEDELDALERGEPPSAADEKEEYEKELEERVFSLDEVELAKRVKQNAEQQRELSLSGLSVLLDIPEERLTRTRDSSPCMLSSPEYWPSWAEDRLDADSCLSCSSPLSSRLSERKESLADDPPKNCDLPVRALSVIKRSVTAKDELLIEKLVKEVIDAYSTNATLIKSNVGERGSRCPRCCSLSKLPTRNAAAKRVSFDCSSLFSTRSEVFGSNWSRHDHEDGVLEYVYVVPTAERPDGRRSGLREVPGPREPDDVTDGPFPDGKRIIGSVGRAEAVSVGLIDCVPADMLIDTGAVASLIDARMLKLVGRGDAPLRPCRRDLISASGHPLRIRGAIDLSLQLGSREIMRPFIVVDKLHIDVILSTDALKAFRAVVDLDENLVTLKDTGEKFSIGPPRVEDVYSTKICSTV